MVSTRLALTAGVSAAETSGSSTRVSTGARSRASRLRVQATADARRRTALAVGLTRVAFPGGLRRPVWRVVCVVGDTQRRPGDREKRGGRASAARHDRQKSPPCVHTI